MRPCPACISDGETALMCLRAQGHAMPHVTAPVDPDDLRTFEWTDDGEVLLEHLPEARVH